MYFITTKRSAVRYISSFFWVIIERNIKSEALSLAFVLFSRDDTCVLQLFCSPG